MSFELDRAKRQLREASKGGNVFREVSRSDTQRELSEDPCTPFSCQPDLVHV